MANTSDSTVPPAIECENTCLGLCPTGPLVIRLLRVGGAVFFDAGRAWGDSSVSNKNNEVLKDVGLGLRIGNPRSGEGRMTHIDFAFPLDGDNSIKDFQLLIQKKNSF